LLSKYYTKIKEYLFGKDRTVGNIEVYLYNRNAKDKEIATNICGITIYKNKKKMLAYLDDTVVTTLPKEITLRGYKKIK